MNPRNALLAIAVAFGIWETTDIFDTGAPAAVFAVLFIAAAIWFWRRRSIPATILIAALCLVEASQAHTWKGAGQAAKMAAEILGTAGIVAAAGVVFARLHPSRLVRRNA